MAEFERVRLQSVVRRLRTRDCKRTPSNSVVGALAPAKKMQRSYFSCAVTLKMHHPASACLLLCTVRAQEQHGFGRKLLGHRSAGALWYPILSGNIRVKYRFENGTCRPFSIKISTFHVLNNVDFMQKKLFSFIFNVLRCFSIAISIQINIDR